MNIAVNTRLLLKDRLEGIGWFMHENLRRITRSQKDHKFLFLFDRSFSPDFIYSDNIVPLVIPPPTRHPALWYIWFQVVLPGVLRKHRADLYMGPDGYMPLNLDIPCHITIHDINFHHRPDDLPWSSRKYYRRYFPRFAEQAGRIATVSEYSRSDISASYNIDAGRIDVVHNGVNEVFSPLSDSEIRRYREEISKGAPYFVYVGALHPRKNIPRLLEAFDRFRAGIDRPYKLVIVGEKMFMTSDISRAYENMRFRNEIIFAGRLKPEQLRLTLGASSGLSYVPLFEGFGIPLLEAMRCEIPILASNTTSLPEIAGKAALYADPENTGEISDAMMRLASDETLVRELVEEGRKQSLRFSWDMTSEKLWESVCKLSDEC